MTGDNQRTANTIAQKLGIRNFLARLTRNKSGANQKAPKTR